MTDLPTDCAVQNATSMKGAAILLAIAFAAPSTSALAGPMNLADPTVVSSQPSTWRDHRANGIGDRGGNALGSVRWSMPDRREAPRGIGRATLGAHPTWARGRPGFLGVARGGCSVPQGLTSAVRSRPSHRARRLGAWCGLGWTAANTAAMDKACAKTEAAASILL